MQIKKNITINLSKDDLKEIILDYFQKEGYSIQKEDIVFLAGRRTEGYGMAEHEVAYFDGCNIFCKEK